MPCTVRNAEGESTQFLLSQSPWSRIALSTEGHDTTVYCAYWDCIKYYNKKDSNFQSMFLVQLLLKLQTITKAILQENVLQVN